MKTALIGILLAAASCGGKAAPESTTGTEHHPDHAMAGTCDMGQPCEKGQMEGMAGKGEMGEMASMPPSIAKFHATLGPRWHAPQGPQRMTDTCAAIGQLRTDAAAIVAAPAPAGANAGSWSASGQQLVDAVTALDATCQAKDAAAFEPAFTRVHTSFHHAMEASMTHDEHGEHGEHSH